MKSASRATYEVKGGQGDSQVLWRPARDGGPQEGSMGVAGALAGVAGG